MLYVPTGILLNMAWASLLACALALCLNLWLHRGRDQSFNLQQQYRLYLSAIGLCLVCPLPIYAWQLAGIGWITTQNSLLVAWRLDNPNSIDLESASSSPLVHTSSIELNKPLQSAGARVFPSELLQTQSALAQPTQADQQPAQTLRETRLSTSLGDPAAKAGQPHQSSQPARSAAAQSRWSWLPAVLVTGWLLGSLVCLWRLLTGLRYLRGLQHSLTKARFSDPSIEFELHRLTGGSVRVYESPLVIAPLTFGVNQPSIVLPAGIEPQLERQELLAVLLHECGHISRHDTRATLAQALAAIVFWWNPLIHVVNRRLHDLREVLCDDYAAQLAPIQHALASAMLKLAELTFEERPHELCLQINGGSSMLTIRIRRLLNSPVHDDSIHDTPSAMTTQPRNWPATAACVLLGIACCIPIVAPQSNRVLAQEQPANLAKPIPSGDEFNIQGSVTDTQGGPLAGVTVWMLLREANSVEIVKSAEHTQSDASGKFAFKLKERANVTLGATTPTTNWAVKHLYTVEPDMQMFDNALVLGDPTQLRLEVEDEAGQPIHRAQLENISWQVTDESERAWLLPELTIPSGLGMPVKIEGNRITIDKLPSYTQQVMLGVAHSEFGLTRIKVAPDPRLVQKVVLRRGYPMHIQLRQSPSQEPIPDQTVELRYYEKGDLESMAFRFPKVDEHGRTTIHLPDSKHVQVTYNHPQYAVRNLNMFSSWGPEQSGQTVTVECSPRAKVRGRVIDAQTQQPAAGVHVGLMITEGQYATTTTTDDDGMYEMEGPAGAAKISITHGGGYFGDEETYVKAELKATETAQAERDLVARRVPPITGTVLENGLPVEDAIVYTDFQHLHTIPAVTDRLGRFTYYLEDDMFSRVIDIAYPAGNSCATLVLPRSPNETTHDLRVELTQSVEVRGSIEGWEPAQAGKKIHLMRQVQLENRRLPGPAITSSVGSAPINERGEFVFRGLNSAHEYRLWVTGEDDDRPGLSWFKLNKPVEQLQPLKNITAADLPLKDDLTVQELTEPLDFISDAWHNSGPLSLPQLKGRTVVVIFFDSTRPDCTREMRWWNWVHDQLSNRGLQIVGIHKHTLPFEKVVEFARSAQVRFPVALDKSPGLSAKALDAYSYPDYHLFDRDGRRLVDRFTPLSLYKHLQRLLEE